MARKALGKGLGKLGGLGALFPGAEETVNGGAVGVVPVDEIKPSRVQPRTEMSEERLEELAASIREKGVLQPIIVRQIGMGYEVVAGERRWRACQKIGLEEMPAIIVDLDDDQAFEVAVIENLQREDLTPLEEARAYKALMERTGGTQEDVARRVGKSRAQIANMVRLLRLAPEVQEMLSDGQISVAHGKVLAGVDSEESQTALARLCREKALNVRALEARVQKGDRKGAPRKPRTGEYKGLEEVLRETLGTKVSVSGRGGRGVIRIEFYDQDALSRLVDLLTEGSEG